LGILRIFKNKKANNALGCAPSLLRAGGRFGQKAFDQGEFME
jgi:hypothetical protein